MIEVELSRNQHLTISVDSVETLDTLTCDGWVVDSVDGVECLGMCETCGLPVLDSDTYCADFEGVIWHQSCHGCGEE